MAKEIKDSKILVVEDETFLRELYQELLEDEGYQVTAAMDGEEALTFLEDNTYDLTLLDIMLPKKDGMSVMEELHNMDKSSHFGKVVMLTNLGQDALVKRGFELGAVGYLIKSSYTPDQILEEVQNFLA